MQSSIVLVLALLTATADCGKPIERPSDRASTPSSAPSSAPSSDQPPASSSPPPNAMAPKPIHLFAQQHSGYRSAAEIVLRDAAAWKGAWQTLHSGDPAEPAPAVDFATDMVVLVSLGEISSGGHSVGIDSVTASGSGAVVRYTVSQPGAGCMTTQALTAPVDVVRVPKAAGAVRFERHVVREDC